MPRTVLNGTVLLTHYRAIAMKMEVLHRIQSGPLCSNLINFTEPTGSRTRTGLFKINNVPMKCGEKPRKEYKHIFCSCCVALNFCRNINIKESFSGVLYVGFLKGKHLADIFFSLYNL